MEPMLPGAIAAAVLTIVLFSSLCASLILTLISHRKPSPLPMGVATGLLVVATVLAALSPVEIPALWGVGVALVGVALGVIGGNPATRVVLDLATGSRVRETSDGGILIGAPRDHTGEREALLRGGSTIGYLERIAVAVAIVAGYPEALAVVVAIKGIGRFSELAAAEARERFIIGTLASLGWASVAGGLVRLAIW